MEGQVTRVSDVVATLQALIEEQTRTTTDGEILRRLCDLRDAPRIFATWLRNNAKACKSLERREALEDAATCIESGVSVRLTPP